jgi:hypothetical protein
VITANIKSHNEIGVALHFFFFLGANAINYLLIAMLSVVLGWH